MKNKNKLFRILIFILICFLNSTTTKSSFDYNFFDYCDWFYPFWSDMHSTITSTEMAVAFTTADYAYHDLNNEVIDSVAKVYSFSNLGTDLPLFRCSFANKKYNLGLTLPFFIETWVDYFEETTSPVINTAYRMGSPEIIFLHMLDKPLLGFLKNYSIKISPFKHESTHLGDELTLFRKNKEMPIVRINVSYNYYELGLTINDPIETLESNHSLRFSFIHLLNKKKGWYNVSSFEGDIDLVEYPTINYEWYAQYQYQTPVFFYLQGIFSAEYRMRVRYNYPYQYLDSTFETPEFKVAEDIWSKLNLNLVAGIRYNNPAIMQDYKVGLAIKFYNGINPYGQFRSIPFFSKAGLCLIFER